MLFASLLAKDTVEFQQAMTAIKRLFYPEAAYLTAPYMVDAGLPDVPPTLTDDQKQKLVLNALDRLAVKFFKKTHNTDSFMQCSYEQRDHVLDEFKKTYLAEISKKPNYSIGSGDPSLCLPLTHNFHDYFSKRKYSFPLTSSFDYQDIAAYTFTLERHNAVNVSANIIDYHHFSNVFAAVSRLIRFFSSPHNVQVHLFADHGLPDQEILAEDIAFAFDTNTNKIKSDRDRGRIFKLLIATLYHDVGKTVVYHRHALEGAIAIAFEARQFLNTFGKILSLSGEAFDGSCEPRLHREDVMFIEDLVHYHDIFGTLGTGETGYIRLVEAIDCTKRYAQRYALASESTNSRGGRLANIESQKQWAARAIFDLWILNLADVMASRPDMIEMKGRDSQSGAKKELKKGDDQTNIWTEEGEWKSIMEKMFKTLPLGANLCHDLAFSLGLIWTHAEKIHTDDMADLESEARKYAGRHSIDRIRRLCCASLATPVYTFQWDTQRVRQKNFDTLLSELKETMDKPAGIMRWHSIIDRLVRSMSDPVTFAQRLAWIGHMDYALPFFELLGEAALKNISDNTDAYSTWLGYKIDDDNLDASIAANVFVENYVAIVVQIIKHLLEREHAMERIRNVEFGTARDRLKPSKEKKSRVLGLQGPYRQQRAIDLVLGSIFVW